MITQTPGRYDDHGCRTPGKQLVFDLAVDKCAGAIAEAKRICGRCPARGYCLEDALSEEGTVSAQYRYGVRGGLGPAERAARAPKRPQREYVDAAPTRATVADLQRRGFNLSWVSREIGRSNLHLPQKRISKDIAEEVAKLADQIGPDLVMPSIARGRPRPRLNQLLATIPEAA